MAENHDDNLTDPGWKASQPLGGNQLSAPEVAKKIRLTRREFITVMGLLAGGSVAVNAAKNWWENNKPPNQDEAELVENMDQPRLFSVAEFKALTTGNDNLARQIDQVAALYGHEVAPDNDWLLSVPMAQQGEAIVVTFSAFKMTANGKSKGGDRPLQIQFQRRSDTQTEAIYTDPSQSNNGPLVHKNPNSTGPFREAYPATSPGNDGFRGWATGTIPDQPDRPAVALVAASEHLLLLYIPATLLQQQINPEMLKLISVSTAALAHPIE